MEARKREKEETHFDPSTSARGTHLTAGTGVPDTDRSTTSSDVSVSEFCRFFFLVVRLLAPFADPSLDPAVKFGLL